jgi:branched-chain amino acid transport system permease protein
MKLRSVLFLLTLGLNLALGLAGLLDFGFAAGFGLGAYTAALLNHFDFTIILLASVAMGSALGFIKGMLALVASSVMAAVAGAVCEYVFVC